MGKVNLAEVSDTRPVINLEDCVLRCIEVEKKQSKAKNNMFVMTWELCSPDTVPDEKDPTKPIKVTGTKITDWVVLGETGLRKLKALHKALKLSMEVDLDLMDPRDYLGHAINAKMKTEPSVLKENDEPVLDDDTGEPVIMNNYRLTRIKSGNEQFTIPAENVAF